MRRDDILDLSEFLFVFGLIVLVLFSVLSLISLFGPIVVPIFSALAMLLGFSLRKIWR